MRHIHGGSILLEHLRTAGLPGGFLEWGEVLCQGPTPGGLAPEAWSAARGAFLGVAPERLAAQDRTLDAAAAGEDELVLWFGPELFCQAILIALLARLEVDPRRQARLSLVSIGSYPGVDDQRACTLGFLNADQLRDVFARRPEVTAQQLELARRVWDAWCAPDPTTLSRLARSPSTILPYLQAALIRHLAEFPAVGTGLSLTEQLLLEVLIEGDMTVGGAFVRVSEREPRRWLTDTILLDTIRDLVLTRVPLVDVDGGWSEPDPNAMPAAMKMKLRLTAAGGDVLAGQQDAVALNGIDRWIGGVHLTSPAFPLSRSWRGGQGVRIWRREPQTGALRRD